MIDWKDYANQLLEEFDQCIVAKPMRNAIEIQIEKDSVAKLARELSKLRAYGTDSEIEDACFSFATKLDNLKKKLVLEILKSGSV